MKVNELKLNNFRGFKDVSLSFSSQINVLVGVNGVGKSSILNAIAILLSRLIWRIRSNKSTGRQFDPKDVMYGQSKTSNTIKICLDEEEIVWTVGRYRLKVKNQTITNLENLNRIVTTIHERLAHNEAYNIPLAVYYSVNRAVLDVPLRIKKTHIFDPLAAYDDALTDKRKENDFRLFFEWFRNREDLENENRRYQDGLIKPENWEFPDRQLEAVRRALSILMPEFKELQVRRNPLRMVVKKNGQLFEIGQLSDGEKCLLAMVGDLARRLALANPYLDNPLHGKGVVLIDEIDLHLHPAWQRIVLSKLTEAFPNCQFIVSTHSPQMLGEVYPSDVILIHQDKVTLNITCVKPKQMYGLSSCEILEEWMDTNRRNVYVEEKINKIFELIDNEQFANARQCIEQMYEELQGDTPDLVRANALLAMLAPDAKE